MYFTQVDNFCSVAISVLWVKAFVIDKVNEIDKSTCWLDVKISVQKVMHQGMYSINLCSCELKAS